MKPKTVTRVGGDTPASRACRPQAAPSIDDSQVGNDAFVGLPLGTEVLTGDGALPIEHLSHGDRVITRDSGFARLLRVDVDVTTAPSVLIKGGTLGHNKPGEDIILPADQPVIVSDWRAQALYGVPRAAVPVRRLVDGEYIRIIKPVKLRLYRLRFEETQILYAGGIEVVAPALTTAAC